MPPQRKSRSVVLSGIRLGAITDEFSLDLSEALQAMHAAGLDGVEPRVVYGRNILDLNDEEIARVGQQVAALGMTVVSIASPLLKCVLPEGGPLDRRIEHDVFGSPYTFEDQPRLTARAFDVADRLGAKIIRVFSYWRTVDPERGADRVASALWNLAEQAASRGLVIGLENEHACSVGTGREARAMVDAVGHQSLRLIWDPANALVLGERPYPDGYAALPKNAVVHVHAKDCTVVDFTPTWGPIGQMGVDWDGQIRALVRDGYAGWINLETHWRGPNGDRLQASRVCAHALGQLVSAARAEGS